ncbi:MAG: glycoside hydrolase family 43 protein [Bacteroidota bacterium]
MKAYHYLLFMILLIPAFVVGQQTFSNPIIPGGYPDPSICRVGEDFYIVNSSFEYFPGLPIHHSKDLVNWELVAYGLHREDQCISPNNLVDVQQRGGIHAPTIRYHDGRFYIITTNVYQPIDPNESTQFINFIITSENIEGPWSEPHHIEDAPGIDPDLFFDDDGKVWYVGNHGPADPNFPGEGEIWLQELDLDNFKLIGNRHFLWRGACQGVWAEGPHMYKKDGWYYLLIAEGGTSFNHAVMIAISDKVTGPYISNPRNPILTTRHLSYNNWVNSTGHADMVELPDGRWYMVALGIRGEEGYHSNMGRESHLIPVQWEHEPFEWKEIKHEYPVAAPETGRVERYTPLPFPDKPQLRNDAFFDNFDSETLHLEWNFRRVPLDKVYSLTERKDWLRLYQNPETITMRGRCSQMGFRQKETDFEYQTKMNFLPENENSEAGISLFLQDDNYINFTVVKKEGKPVLQLKINERKKDAYILKSEALESYTGDLIFKVVSQNNKYQYLYSVNGGMTFIKFEETASDLIICHGYTGAYLGLYTSGNGTESKEYTDFDWVSYKGFPDY